MKTNKKTLVYFSLIIFAIIIAAMFIFYNRPASYEGVIYAGVESEIIINRDKTGIPFIKANTINDSYFAIGLLHAQDRLTLIEYFRAIAAGKVSEIAGKEGVFLDKLSLTIGFNREAKNIVNRLKSPYKDYLSSYVSGINASKKNISQSYRALAEFSMNEWSIEDVVSILLLFDWADSFLNNKELIFPFPKETKIHLLKDILPEKLLFQYSEEEKASINLLRKIQKTIMEWIGPFQQGFAFYISGKNVKENRSVTGFNIDGDMSVFPKWYPFTLTIGDAKIDGISASGLPFIFFGSNEGFSFFGFNLNVDTQDFCKEKIKKVKNIEQYNRNGRWKKFDEIDERIYIGDKDVEENEVRISVRKTDIGPVISDLYEEEDNKYCLSLNSISLREDYIRTLFDIPFASSLSEAKRYARNVNSLPRIYLFAESKRAVQAYSGKFYRRNHKLFFKAANKIKGKGLIDLSGYSRTMRGKNIIIGDMIFNNEPSVLNDFIVFKDTNRLSRLEHLFVNENGLTSRQLTASLTDTRSKIAEKYVSFFLPLLEQIPITSAKLCKIYFNNWDYRMDLKSVPATIFQTLLINMIKETIADEFEDDSHLIMENYHLITEKYYDMIIAGNSTLFDDKSTKDIIEDRDNIFYRAFIKALRYLNRSGGPKMEEWKWGLHHRGRFNIPLNADTFFYDKPGQLDDLSVSGGNSTIKKGSVNAIDLLKPGNISFITCFFYLDIHLSFISFSAPPSIDPKSEYYRNFHKENEFISFDVQEVIHKLRIISNRAQ